MKIFFFIFIASCELYLTPFINDFSIIAKIVLFFNILFPRGIFYANIFAIFILVKNNIIGLQIRLLRRSAKPHITQSDLVARLQIAGIHIEQPALSKIERGIRPVTDVEINAFAKALGVPISALFEKPKKATMIASSKTDRKRSYTITPKELAQELGKSEKRVRQLLRDICKRPQEQKGNRWHISRYYADKIRVLYQEK